MTPCLATGMKIYFCGMVAEVVNSVEDVVVEAEGPLEFEGAGLGEILLLFVVLILCIKLQNLN